MTRLLLVAVLLAGCTGWPPRLGGSSARNASAEALLDDARGETEAGRPKNAVTIYENVARDFAGTDSAAMALHELAILRLDLRSPLRDPRLAQQTLARLAKDYPKTRWGREAAAWRVLFREAARCQEQANQLGADAERLRQTIDSLKNTDVDLEEVP